VLWQIWYDMSTETTDVTEVSADTVPSRGTQPVVLASPTTKRKTRKRKRKAAATKTHILSQFTIRNPPWSYLHLQHINTDGKSTPDLDTVTAHLHLKASLTQFLGLHGSAVPIDVLKVEDSDVWIRVPNPDMSAVVAAVGGWVSSNGEGWRIKGSSSWDARALARDSGQDLFHD
jgi:ribonuclease P/MRP protein subunit POP8